MKLSNILEGTGDSQFDAAWNILRGHFESELVELAKSSKMSVEDAALVVYNALQMKGSLVLFATLMRGLKKKNPEGWRVVQAQKARRALLTAELEKLVAEKAQAGGPPPTQH